VPVVESHATTVEESMRLATIAFSTGISGAVVRDGHAAPVPGYPDVGAILIAGDAGTAAASAAADADAWHEFSTEDLRLPVTNPSAVFCVGLNYRAHMIEMGREPPEHPTLFAKQARALTNPFAPVQLPLASAQVDYEGELVIVIGRAGRDIPEETAPIHIAGYCLMNDVTMRDWQYRTIQWFAGKNFERATPVGPFVVTPDEFSPDSETIEVTVNGALRQRAPLADLVFGASQLVADISRITTLRPGDLIATGTPGGVGHSMKPASYLCDGDVVEVRVNGIGSISNRFEAAA
jgi:acylpyruvate hydrolase